MEEELQECIIVGKDEMNEAIVNVVNMAYDHGYKVFVVSLVGESLYNIEHNYDEVFVVDHAMHEEDIYNEHIRGHYKPKYFIGSEFMAHPWRELGIPALTFKDAF